MDRSFDDFFSSLGIGIAAATIIVSMMNVFIEYYFYYIILVVCLVLGTIAFTTNIESISNTHGKRGRVESSGIAEDGVPSEVGMAIQHMGDCIDGRRVSIPPDTWMGKKRTFRTAVKKLMAAKKDERLQTGIIERNVYARGETEGGTVDENKTCTGESGQDDVIDERKQPTNENDERTNLSVSSGEGMRGGGMSRVKKVKKGRFRSVVQRVVASM